MISSFEFDEDILMMNIAAQGCAAINDKTVEELAELIQALQKNRLCMKEEPPTEVFVKHRQNLIEEIADVYIVLENTKIVFGIEPEKIQEVIDTKQERQAKRVAGELPYVD